MTTRGIFKVLPTDVCALISSYIPALKPLHTFIYFATVNAQRQYLDENDEPQFAKNDFMTTRNCELFFIPAITRLQQYSTPFKVRPLKSYKNKGEYVTEVLTAASNSIDSLLTVHRRIWKAELSCNNCLVIIHREIPITWNTYYQPELPLCIDCYKTAYCRHYNLLPSSCFVSNNSSVTPSDISLGINLTDGCMAFRKWYTSEYCIKEIEDAYRVYRAEIDATDHEMRGEGNVKKAKEKVRLAKANTKRRLENERKRVLAEARNEIKSMNGANKRKKK